MPGQVLDIDIPLSTEAFYPAFVKIIAAIQTIVADLEPQVVPAEIDFSQGDVDLAGNDLLGAQSVQLEAASATTGYPSGSAVVVGGEWYLVTDDGAVQVTSGGALNAAGIGGIVGDYGGANPAKVTYVDSDEVYQFTDDVGDWSSIEVDNLILHGAGAAMTFSVSDVLVSNKNITYASTFVPVGPGRALLTCDEAGVLRSSEGGSVSISPTFTDDIILSGAEIQHTAWKRTFLPTPQPNGATTWTRGSSGFVTNTVSTGFYEYRLDGWLVGDVITTIKISYKGTAAGDDLTLIDVFQVDQTGTEVTATPSPTHVDNIGTSYSTTTVSLTSPINVGEGEAIVLRITPSVVGISLGPVVVTYTH